MAITTQTHESKRKILRNKLLHEGIVLPGAYNALVAKQVQQLGFEGLYISGAALSASAGLPDIGLLSLHEFTFFMKYIVEAVNIPVIADADTGFGGAVNTGRTVEEYERIGLAGLHIEDQIMPKRCGHLEGKSLVSTEEMCQKIRTATLHRKDPNFLIIARTDARSVEGFDQAINRAKAYLDAGADAIFPEALKTKEEFALFAKNINAPLLANMTEFGVSPLLSVQELQQMGYKLIIFPVSSLRYAMKATEDFLLHIKTHGSQQGVLDNMQTRKELYELIEYEKYAQLDKNVANYKL